MIQVYLRNSKETIDETVETFPLEIGRSDEPQNQDQAVRKIVVEQDEYVSRHHVRLEQPSEGSFLLKNLSSSSPIKLSDGTSILPGESSVSDQVVLHFTIGETRVDVEPLVENRYATIAAPRPIQKELLRLTPVDAMPSVEELTGWFDTLIQVQRAAAGSADFYDRAAEAVVSIIGFDEGLVLLREDDDWTIAGHSDSIDPAAAGFSRSILHKVFTERRTFYDTDQQTQSLAETSAVACSPVFDATGEIVEGVVYGCRFRKSGPTHISPLQAQLLQTLAGVISIGMARVTQQTVATRLRAQFDSFFSPKLARELERDPTLLDGREKEVTVFFADIRGFSRLSEKLTPNETCNLVSDVMQCLSTIILSKDGVIVEFLGDGLMAMWNAPTEQPNHAELACQTALEVRQSLPCVSSEWEHRVGGPIRLGIGINSGPALVGNTGTPLILKYGALGHTVNLASRVEGATKQLGVPILITRETQRQLGESQLTRRLCQVRVLGIDETVELYELYGDDQAGQWSHKRQVYENALALFEKGDWSAACQCIQPLLLAHENETDLPSLILAGRAIDCLKSPPTSFDPVMDLDRK